MGIMLKDMEKMPKSCFDCPLFHFYIDIDGVLHNVCKYGNIEMYGNLTNKRHDSCKLMEVGE